MFKIRKHNKKWRLAIVEEWEFDNPSDMMECLGTLMEYKFLKGDLR